MEASEEKCQGSKLHGDSWKTDEVEFDPAQEALPSVTSPTNIANEIFKAATNHKGKLHIISGGDAKMYSFMKKLLPERAFQKVQIRSIMQPLSKLEVSFAKWLMGSNIGKLEATPKK